MNFRRRHSRDHGARSRSSDWVYPQIAKGSEQRARFGTKRRVAAFEEDFARWMKDPEFAEAYNKAREAADAFARDGSLNIPRGSNDTDL